MKDIIIPKVPAEFGNKTFGESDIKWIKTVNDPDTSSAYLPPDLPYKRVITNVDGIFFCLQINPRFSKSLEGVAVGELILIYQRLDNQKTKCFTHLVTPIDPNSKVIQSPYGPNSGWPGRWVKVIAMTANKANNSIPLASTIWQTMGFTGQHHDLSYRDGRVREIDRNQNITTSQLTALKKDIWGKF